LWDAGEIVGHLVSAGSMFAFLAEHRGQLFPDEDYADLFIAGVGRPSLPATRMAAVLTLQALHDLSDRECAEAVRCDLRWKVACGLSLLDEGFDPSTLTYWRRRIAISARPHRINDAIRRVIEATGVLRGRRRRAVDSTIVDDAVATQDTLTQLIGAIRRVAREVPGAAAVIAAECTGHDYSKPGKPRIDWTDPEAKDALVSALVNDANAVVAALAGAELDERAEAVLALLALVAGQDVEPADGSDGRDGRWRIARRVAPERVISTVDPETRHTRKSQHNRKDGYRAHLVGEPETGLITDEQLTQAAGPDNADAAVAAQFLARTEPQASMPRDSEPRDSEPRDSEPRDSEPRDSEPRRGRRHCAGRRGRRRRGGAQARGRGSGLVRRLGVRHRGFPRGDRAGRTPCGDQAQAGAARRRGRIHLRRLHRRRAGRHRHLPGREDPAAVAEPDRDLRRPVPRLPATRPLHHIEDGALADPARTRRPAARRPRGLGRRSRPA
jgi:hypothetical protein